MHAKQSLADSYDLMLYTFPSTYHKNYLDYLISFLPQTSYKGNIYDDLRKILAEGTNDDDDVMVVSGQESTRRRGVEEEQRASKRKNTFNCQI